MATSSVREARRRKIIERGSDRLALITGQIQTLSPDLQHHNPIDSSGSTPPEGNLGGETGLGGGNEVSPLSKFETAFSGGNEVTPLSTFETSCSDTASRSLGDEGTELRSPMLSSTDLSSAPERHVESLPQKRVFWSPKQLSSAIAATERARLLCSVVFSILVVLSSAGFPVLGWRIFSTVLSFRPLCLVLVTNVTVVFLRLLEKQRSPGSADRGRGRSRSDGGNDLADQLGKTLEVGLLMRKVADALFMDCAVYAVIVVCGLSIAERFR